MKEAIKKQEEKKKEHLTPIRGKEDHSQTSRTISNALETFEPKKKKSGLLRMIQSGKEKISNKYHSVVQKAGWEEAPLEEEQRPNQLTMEEKNKLTKYRGSYFQKILTKVNQWNLSQDQRDNPPLPEKTETKDKISSGFTTVKDGVVSPIADIISAAGFETAGKITGALKGGMEQVERFAKVAKSLISSGKRYLSSTDKEESMTLAEMKKDIKDDLELLGSIISCACEKLSSLSSLSPPLGIIVKLIGTILGGMSKFYTDIKTLFKTRKNIKRMRKQKDIAKRDIYETQQANGTSYVKKSKFSDKLKFMKSSDMREKISITDQIETERATSGADASRKNLYIRSMEDYAISKELTGANQKRRNESLFNLIVQELGPVISTAVMFAGPGGVLAGGVMDAVLSSLNGLKTIAGAVTTIGHKVNAPFVNSLKSPEAKMRKRHKLSVYMFDRLKEIAPLEQKLMAVPETTYDVKTIFNVRNYLPMRKFQKERITAMGVDQEKMAKASDASVLLNIMRKGFYRESQ